MKKLSAPSKGSSDGHIKTKKKAKDTPPPNVGVTRWGNLETIKLSLKENEERELIKVLLCYDEALTNAFKHFKPHILASYLLEVCRSFNQFYHKCRILGGESAELEASRVTLVKATQRVLQEGLAVLGISSPEAM